MTTWHSLRSLRACAHVSRSQTKNKNEKFSRIQYSICHAWQPCKHSLYFDWALLSGHRAVAKNILKIMLNSLGNNVAFLVQSIMILCIVQLLNTIVVARYFEPSATQEMLDLWRPLLCPFDPAALQRTFGFLDWFLPTLHLPHEAGLGYELWFNEFMDLWKTCHNSPPWESVSFL